MDQIQSLGFYGSLKSVNYKNSMDCRDFQNENIDG